MQNNGMNTKEETDQAIQISQQLCDELILETHTDTSELVDLCVLQAMSGDTQKKAAGIWFATHKPKWPRFDAWRIEQYAEQDKEDAKSFLSRLKCADSGPIQDTLNFFTVQEIKDLCKQLDVKISGKAKKSLFIESVTDAICAGNKIKPLRSLIRQRMQEKREKELAHAVVAQFHEMGELFLNRHLMIHMMRIHWLGFEENKDERPYLMFDAINDSRTREQCIKLDNTIKRVGDQFWKKHPVPCEKLLCRCSLRSLSEREAVEMINSQH